MIENAQTHTLVTDEDPPGLYAYRSVSHKAITLLTLMIPIVFVVILISTADSLGEMVKTTIIQRVALIVHGLYFAALPFGFELFLKELPPFTWNFFGIPPFGKLPEQPDNLYWMMTCLSGELFFLSALCFFLIAVQDKVPRWTLLLPLAQCVYNLKNDLLWVGLSSKFSPIKQRNTIMFLDWASIGVFFIVYIHHYFSADSA